MSDPDRDNRRRNQEIAENEAAREARNSIRLSAWTVGAAFVIGFILLAIFLKR